MPQYALDAWLRPLLAEQEGGVLRLGCPTAFHLDKVRERYLAEIRRCVEEESEGSVGVELAVVAAPARPAPPAKPPAAPPKRIDPRRGAARRPEQRELPYTFDSFVVGPCNALAREAAIAVAHDRQRRLNPLYLCSDAGLGKTHLARAIQSEVSARSGRRVLYASAEAFLNEFTRSLRSREMDRFKRRYREGCDLLVVEDVQFLKAKTATQLELFHTLGHLLEAGARVVLTGDRLPRDIESLETRLRSQMSAGLVAELEPPDAAVRRRILRNKAAAGAVRLPDECLDLLVDSVRGSVRDLEGVLIQLVESASLLKRPIDASLTRMALRKLSPPLPDAARLAPHAVIAVVAAFFRTPPEALASRSRRREVLVPRQLAMYLCRRYTDAPASAIAQLFGRNHPSVGNAVKVVERRILERAPLRYQVEALTSRLDELVRNSDRRG